MPSDPSPLGALSLDHHFTILSTRIDKSNAQVSAAIIPREMRLNSFPRPRYLSTSLAVRLEYILLQEPLLHCLYVLDDPRRGTRRLRDILYTSSHPSLGRPSSIPLFPCRSMFCGIGVRYSAQTVYKSDEAPRCSLGSSSLPQSIHNHLARPCALL